MGNENPTKKAEICGERIQFIGLHCIATVPLYGVYLPPLSAV